MYRYNSTSLPYIISVVTYADRLNIDKINNVQESHLGYFSIGMIRFRSGRRV
jgi:hypothetical protein